MTRQYLKNNHAMTNSLRNFITKTSMNIENSKADVQSIYEYGKEIAEKQFSNWMISDTKKSRYLCI